ncbi:MAG: site-specific integrase [Prevotellaceae bacterium]|jgi:site-specific recombinase XerD|nr:site-specific integrase [Prevotellaceae bacterium]
MAKLIQKYKQNPKLAQNILADGRISLYLDYYLGYSKQVDTCTGQTKIKHSRKKETLNLYLIQPIRTADDRETNRETLALAEAIRREKEQELKKDIYGYRLKAKSGNFLDYFQSYIDNYTKKDVRVIKQALNRFKDFLAANYPLFQTFIKPSQLNKEMMLNFVEYLKSRSTGEGACGCFKRFKKVIKYAVEHDVLTTNPCAGIVCKVDAQTLRKDILSIGEIQQLIATTYNGQNNNIRRAFIFCLYTGIRFCDVKDLTYGNVDFQNKILKFEQDKTKGHSAASGVVIPLNDGLLSLIKKPVTDHPKEERIFILPSATMCLRALRHWTKRAGIDKHITWHCARHSFAVNILNNGANIKTVASLLGHSGLKHTEKYTRAVDSLKEAAINSLPLLNLKF